MEPKHNKNESNSRFLWQSNAEHIIITVAHAVTCEAYFAINIIKPGPEKPTIYHLLILNIIFGLPIIYMQLIIGKFARTGCLFFSRFMPISTGLGYSMFTVCLLQSFGYSVLLAKVLYYFAMAFSVQLPWMFCRDNWSKHCVLTQNQTHDCEAHAEISSFDFYKYVTLNLRYNQETDEDVAIYSMDTFGVIALCAVFTMLYLYTLQEIKGIKLVLKFYAIASLICTMVLVGLITLVSLGKSYAKIFQVNVDALTNVQAWFHSVQIIVSTLAIDNGVHFLYGSYVKNEVSLNKIALSINFIIFICCVIFAIITHGAYDLISGKIDCDVDKMEVNDLMGRELLFIFVPNALGLLGIPQTWNIIYFLSLVLIGINSVVTRIDYLFSSLVDQFPGAEFYKTYILGFTCILGILCGAPFMGTDGNKMMQYIFFEAVRNTSYITLTLLTMSVFWLYTVDRLSIDVHFMDGAPPAMFWKTLWIFSTFIGVFGLILELGFGVGIARAPVTTPTYRLIRKLQYIAEALIVFPILLGVIFSISRQLKRHNLPALFLPGDNWGPPDFKLRADRKMFNPRKETRYCRLVDDCKHHCLCGNTILKAIIQFEEEERKAELEMIDKAMKPTTLNDEEEEQKYEEDRAAVYRESHKF